MPKWTSLIYMALAIAANAAQTPGYWDIFDLAVWPLALCGLVVAAWGD